MTERMPLLEVGKLLASVHDLEAKHGEPPWSHPVVLTDDIQAFIICHAPGHPNDTHYHLHDEWWVVLQGEIDWYVEDEPAPIHAKAGDFVFGPNNRWHHTERVGSEPSIRIAINARGEFHRYDRPGCSLSDRVERMMEAFEAVRTLLAVRRYLDRPIPEDIVKK